ncbi:MAG: 8-amino-7-oxononanoate synthase, partial [Polyangiaceae bacterium]|nr:8-amino-7-oxononanoate synthase [Polyangiaceae bacterium]
VLAAAKQALEVDGLGSAASRLITGSMDAHLEAEATLAAFVRAEASLFFSTGYAANVGAIQALADPSTLVLSDALNHASLIDGIRLSRARAHVYRHADLEHAESLLREHRADASRALIVTDAVFSMDGDIAPLRELRALADRYDAWLFVDEAHSLGVFGPGGRGLCAREGITADVLVGMLGKSFGLAGAFVAGERALRELLVHRARSYVFSTAPSPILARAATAAVGVILESDALREQLLAHASRLRTALPALGFEVPPGQGPIVPVILGEADRTMRASAALLEAGFLAQGIRPPTVPRGTSRIRLVPMGTHEHSDIDALIDAFATLAAQGL